MHFDDLDEEFENTFGYSGRDEGYDDDDMNEMLYDGDIWSKKKNKSSQPQKQPEPQGCYVATAVYGSYDCPQVWTLRRYRDNQLAKTWYGRLFIHTYYAVSPTLVKWFGGTQWFKNMWKPKLDNIVEKLQENGVESTPYEDKNW